jgi:hypothetical protein
VRVTFVPTDDGFGEEARVTELETRFTTWETDAETEGP